MMHSLLPNAIKINALTTSHRNSRFFSDHLQNVRQQSKRFSSHRSERNAESNPRGRLYGQPMASTHPHLFNGSKGELTPGTSLNEYKERRRRFLDYLPSSPQAIDAIIPSFPLKIMSNDIPFPYHPYTNFLWLCGFREPDSALWLRREPNGNTVESLFVLPRDPVKEMWDGPRSGLDGAKSLFGVDRTFEFSQAQKELKEVFQGKDNTIYYVPRIHPKMDNAIDALYSGGSSSKLIDPTHYLSKLRLKKSQSELELMRRAGDIAAESMRETMRFTFLSQNSTEHQISAFMEYRIKMRGSSNYSYPPVVACGPNANTLHYIANDMPLKSGELLLMDAGAEMNGYVSDITRVWPVNGKFSQAQREIYEVVLRANKACIEHCDTSKAKSMRDIGQLGQEVLTKGLKELGLMKSRDSNISRFFPHSIGHWLGMDTHDVQEVSSYTNLEPGMVVTIEPGLYIPFDSDIPPQYRGIGIRIEDNVVITDSKPEVLTWKVPKEIEDIERAMSEPIDLNNLN
eukprot:TRINITY_DN5600_c0_g2_i1.p1 TRINITY_DN5600_c0_g2~~TRINITY_DN5600_c0_g2_i1.p1  ORF type:complete len:513 (+),score=145.13 TRINITY_DN5600_c0_g2_i1:281-1819(+)